MAKILATDARVLRASSHALVEVLVDLIGRLEALEAGQTDLDERVTALETPAPGGAPAPDGRLGASRAAKKVVDEAAAGG